MSAVGPFSLVKTTCNTLYNTGIWCDQTKPASQTADGAVALLMLVKKGNNMLAMITPTLRKDSLVLLFVVGVTIASVSADSDVIAETNCGHIRGKLNSTTNIASFKGIPYAAPPLGKLRWSSPISREQAGMCWGPKTVLDTLDFGPFCAQFQQGGQEDCLYLNVWSPWNQSSSKPLPVMVYIYGGDLTDGNTNLYPMDYIAEPGDVVAVSMNYRLNLFGFLATRELSQVSFLMKTQFPM